MGGKVSNKGSNSKVYWGDCAGVLCQGAIDFFWGVEIDNNLVYPLAIPWDSKLHTANQQFIWTNGNCYKAGATTAVDPPAFPWVLVAAPYNNATTYHNGDKVLGADNSLWQRSGGTSTGVAPQATKPTPVQFGYQAHGGPITNTIPNPVISGWTFLSKPPSWPGGGIHQANAIVSYNGRIYTTPSATNNQPPAAPWVLWSINRGSVSNPFHFVIKNYGDAWLYWGTATQTLDATEAFLLSGNHPAYRNKAVLVLKNFLFGQGNASPPSVRVLAARAPAQSLITGAATALDGDWQANPWTVLSELLTNPIYGLGLPNALLDATSWQSEADRCYANTPYFYISPMITSNKKVREVVADILSYVDGFVYWTTAGLLAAGHWPHGEAAPAYTAANTINRDNAVQEIDWQTDGWGGTFNNYELTFRDINAAFKTNMVSAPNLWNKNITKRLLAQRLDRPHIVRSGQALQQAAEAAKIGGDQQKVGSIPIRGETATGVTPGKIFKLTDDVLQSSDNMRCTKLVRARPPNGNKTVYYETERGVNPIPYAATPGLPPASPGLTPNVLSSFQLFKLSSRFNLGDAITAIASRTGLTTSHFDLWMQSTDLVNLQNLGVVTRFAVSGLLDRVETYEADTELGLGFPSASISPVTQGVTYSIGAQYMWAFQCQWGPPGSATTVATPGADFILDADAGTITIVSGGAITTGSEIDMYFDSNFEIALTAGIPADDIEAVSFVPTNDEVQDGTILMFLFQAADPTKCEIVSVAQLTAVGVGIYQINGKRAMFGTRTGGDGSHKWDVNDIALIIRKADLVAFTDQSFKALEATGGTGHFVLAPGTSGYDSDPSQIYDPNTNPGAFCSACDYVFNDPFAPQITWDSLLVNGGAVNFATTYATTDVFDFSFTIFDTSGKGITASLVAANGNIEKPLWSGQVDPVTGSQSVEVTFTLGTGTWQLVMKMTNTDGRLTFQNLQSPVGTDVQILIGATTAPAPVLLTWDTKRTSSYVGGVLVYNYVVSNFHINGYTDTNVQYQITAKGAQPSGGSWVNATSLGGGLWKVGPAMIANTHTLWLLGIQGGRANSAPIPNNFHF